MKRTNKKFIEISGKMYHVYLVQNVSKFYDLKTLNECYNNCSEYKQSAYRNCVENTLEIEKHINAHSKWEYGVYSYNTCMFSFAANFYKDGELIATYYETRTRRELRVKEGVIV